MACSSSSFSSSPRGAARRRFPWLIVALSLTVATSSSCSHDSYLKVTLLSANSEITDVARVVVSVGSEQNNSSAWLDYVPPQPISFNTMAAKTFSISFTPSQSGTIFLDVGVQNSSAECLGRGTASALIKKGDVTSAIVSIVQGKACPTAPDAGTGSEAGADADANTGAVTFPGCDPANPSVSCKANQTCFVNCAASRGECLAAGTKGPGESCTANTDCVPGAQCFDYSGLPGCGGGTKICQKFCNNDAQCAAIGGTSTGTAGAGGTSGVSSDIGSAGGASGAAAAGGTGGQMATVIGAESSCRNPVVCGANVTTSYRTCSIACDPRGDASLGCAKGLLCFLFKDLTSGKESPDCGCREPSRTKTDGMSCMSSTDCAPGFVCSTTDKTQVCRKLCQMTSPSDCASGTCSALTNTAFGVCVGG